MRYLETRLRILETYTALATLAVITLVLSGFMESKQKFGEVDVERLNVVDKNGQLRLVIANSERMPDPIVNGKPFKTERPPGILFYNGLGDEDGGIVFGAAAKDSQFGAYGGLSFDQYKQSQIVAVTYNDHSGSREAGLKVWDRPDTPISDLIRESESIETEGAGKAASKQKLREEDLSPTRVFVGRDKDKQAKVTLYDAQGKARINMVVDANGDARLYFLDQNGAVTYSLPDKKTPQ